MSNSNNLTGYMSGDGGSALSAFPENPSTQDGVCTDARDSAHRTDDGRRGSIKDVQPSNTTSSNCNTGGFTPLRWGIDSLYLSYAGKLKSHQDSYLRRLKEKAQSPIPSVQATAQLKLEGHIFEVKDRGLPYFPIFLKTMPFVFSSPVHRARCH